jgi:transposase
MRYITLKTEEIKSLEQILKSSTNNTIRKRSQCLLLSYQSRTKTDLSGSFKVNRRTIERWFDAWAERGVDSLPTVTGRGIKTCLKGYEKEISEQSEIHSRNLKNVLLYLEKKHNISICKKTFQNFLIGTGL